MTRGRVLQLTPQGRYIHVEKSIYIICHVPGRVDAVNYNRCYNWPHYVTPYILRIYTVMECELLKGSFTRSSQRSVFPWSSVVWLKKKHEWTKWTSAFLQPNNTRSRKNWSLMSLGVEEPVSLTLLHLYKGGNIIISSRQISKFSCFQYSSHVHVESSVCATYQVSKTSVKGNVFNMT